MICPSSVTWAIHMKYRMPLNERFKLEFPWISLYFCFTELEIQKEKDITISIQLTKKENDNRTEFNQSSSSIGIDKWKHGFQTFPVVRNPGEWLLGFHRFTSWIFDIPTPFLTSFQLAA